MRTRDVYSVIIECLKARIPLILWGSPGVAKTELVMQAILALGWDMIVSYPGTDDPTDIKGFGALNHATMSADFYQYGNVQRAMTATRNTAWLIDDFGAGAAAVQAGYGQPVMGRHINGKPISEFVSFVICTNSRRDKSGVAGVLEMFKSRCILVEVTPHTQDWIEDFAVPNDLDPTIIAYHTQFPKPNHEQLCNFMPTSDMKNSPSPRTWYRVHQIIGLGMSPPVEQDLFCGAIGDGEGMSFAGYKRTAATMEKPDNIILNPDTARIPEELSALWATSIALAMKVKPRNFAQILRYAERLEANGQSEFGTVIMEHCRRKEPLIIGTPAGIKLADPNNHSAIADAFRAATPSSL